MSHYNEIKLIVALIWLCFYAYGNKNKACEATLDFPCIFPFKYKEEKYYNCTNKDHNTFWCRTVSYHISQLRDYEKKKIGVTAVSHVLQIQTTKLVKEQFHIHVYFRLNMKVNHTSLAQTKMMKIKDTGVLSLLIQKIK